jgi:hypothetical protein
MNFINWNGPLSFTRTRMTVVRAIPRFRLHDLRQRWAPSAAMAGIDLVTLAAMLIRAYLWSLGYAHPTEKHQFAAMKKLEVFRMAK